MKKMSIKDVHDFYQTLIEERDRLYEQRFHAAEVAVATAFNAHEKVVAANFLGSEKAISKTENIIEERNQLYQQQFHAAEVALAAALNAHEKAVAAAFLSSEKAIIKAEEAQKDYNARSNEFRGQLDDQAKTLMPRPETVALFKAIDEKLNFVQQTYDRRLETILANIAKTDDNHAGALADLRLAVSHRLTGDVYETRHAELQHQVNELRETRSEISGKSAGANALWGYLIGIAGIAIAILSHFFR